MSRPKLLVLLIILSSAGCAKLAHLDELLRLKDLSENRDGQEIFVQKQNKNFEKLSGVAKANNIASYKDEKTFIKEFGRPIVSREITSQDQPLTQWLYRYSTQKFGSPKVYLYFDNQEKLVRWEYYPRDNSDDPSAKLEGGTNDGNHQNQN